MINYSKWAKIDDSGRITLAKRVLHVDGLEITCPKEDTLRRYDYLPIADSVPEEREGMYAVVVRHEVRDGEIWPVYDYEPIPADEGEVTE